MSRAPRVVLDTNVVLSALLFSQGRLTPLRRCWRDARFHPLVSQDTVAELLRVLAYPKFRLTAEDREELLADYLPWCTTIRIPAKPPATPPCRDPFDLPFLQLALAGKADWLVTGDRDLISLAGDFACPIVAPDEFLGALET